MTAEKTTRAFGRYVYGLGVMMLGVLCLVFGEFNPGQPVPSNFPMRTVLLYAAAAFMVIAGAAVEWRRSVVCRRVWSASLRTAGPSRLRVGPR